MKKTAIFVLFGLLLIFGALVLFVMQGQNDYSQIIGKAVQEVPKEKVRIGYRAHLLYLPAYVAQAKGYYSEEGLDVELLEFESTNQLVDAVLSGKIDAGVGGVNALVPLTIESKSSGSMRIFSLGVLTDDFDALIVPIGSPISSIRDLKGKTVSIIPGTAGNVWMQKMAQKERLEGDIVFIEQSESVQLDALASGSVDAAFVMEPLASVAVSKGIGRVLVKSPISVYYQENMVFETSVFSASFVEKRPDAARKLVSAVDKAIIFINENPGEARQYYSNFTPVDESIGQSLPVTRYIPSYELDAVVFQKQADYFVSSGLLKSGVNVSGILWG